MSQLKEAVDFLYFSSPFALWDFPCLLPLFWLLSSFILLQLSPLSPIAIPKSCRVHRCLTCCVFWQVTQSLPAPTIISPPVWKGTQCSLSVTHTSPQTHKGCILLTQFHFKPLDDPVSSHLSPCCFGEGSWVMWVFQGCHEGRDLCEKPQTSQLWASASTLGLDFSALELWQKKYCFETVWLT